MQVAGVELLQPLEPFSIINGQGALRDRGTGRLTRTPLPQGNAPNARELALQRLGQAIGKAAHRKDSTE